VADLDRAIQPPAAQTHRKQPYEGRGTAWNPREKGRAREGGQRDKGQHPGPYGEMDTLNTTCERGCEGGKSLQLSLNLPHKRTAAELANQNKGLSTLVHGSP